MFKVATVVGARPQFIKAAALSRAFQDRPGLVEVMVHTGQHFDEDMSDVFFEELQIPRPQHSLGIHGGGHGRMTGQMLEALEVVMSDERPDAVVVYGDTNSTLAGALAAAKLHIPVAHVEAGLRSFNRRMPEEVNRVLTDHTSSLLFCPTYAAVENLRAEGITDGVSHTGDVMYDASLFAAELSAMRSQALDRLGVVPGEFSVATVHRAENTDEADCLETVLDYLRTEAASYPMVFPLHPRTRQAAERFGLNFHGLRVCSPLGYLDMASLVSQSRCVYTDSGGLQKEAYFHRRPCVTLRAETEWVETVASGWNRLWRGPDFNARREIGEYGDGRAAQGIAALLEDYLNGGSPAAR